MKKIESISNDNYILNYKRLIESHINTIKEKSPYSQKITEVCHIGKLLIFLNEYSIHNIQERPDCIITNGKDIIGLEHELIVDKPAKEIEGYFEKICCQVESSMLRENYPSFLANVYFNTNYPRITKDKSNNIKTIHNLIRNCLESNDLELNGYYSENYFDNDSYSIVNRITIMKHSGISINSNCGAWWQKSLKIENLIDAIEKKEKKINSYIEHGISSQWLLLVIGSLGASSFEVNETIDLKINSSFNKIFLLEDFRNNLYEIK